MACCLTLCYWQGQALTVPVLADLAGHQLVVEEGRYYTCNRLKVRPLLACVVSRATCSKEHGTQL